MKPLSHVEALAAEEQSFQTEITKLEEEIELCPATSYHQRPPQLPDALQQALQEIKDRKNQVCVYYEQCGHAGCASSYEAFAIADKALSGLEGE